MFGPPFSPSLARGVLHIRRVDCPAGGPPERTVASVRVVPLCRPLAVEYPAAPLALLSPLVARRSPSATGLGHMPSLFGPRGDDPQPLPPVGSSNVVGSDNRPFRIVPSLAKLSENGAEVFVSKEAWYVLQQQESWSYHANQSVDGRPKIPLVAFSPSLSRNRERLARKPRRPDVRVELPQDFGIDESEVAKVQCPRPVPVVDGAAERVDFGIRHGAVAAGHLETQPKPTDAAA
jgi:hypothetical protein